jgi:hypothetical protein
VKHTDYLLYCATTHLAASSSGSTKLRTKVLSSHPSNFLDILRALVNVASNSADRLTS